MEIEGCFFFKGDFGAETAAANSHMLDFFDFLTFLNGNICREREKNNSVTYTQHRHDEYTQIYMHTVAWTYFYGMGGLSLTLLADCLSRTINSR